MLTRRIIPCLDVKDGMVVKGVRFRAHQILGEIIDLAGRYATQGADELVFYDITASAENRSVSRDWVARVARVIDIPFCVAGGIRKVEDAREVLNAGADKVSINSPALENPELIEQLAREFGSQCVVVGIDSQREEGEFVVYQYTGSEERVRSAKRKTMEWIQEAVHRGAGEIVLNCMSHDGVGTGYDIEQLVAARSITPVPLIASGGAGRMEHFPEVFKKARVDGALAAGVFHRQEIKIPALKRFCREQGVFVREEQR